ncbi:MAG: hypothetical protein MUO53_01765 [Maribacter sp.]|nr:hypothetical protein [Maribacter sp.]
MRYLKKGFLILLLPLMAFTAIHKFYLTVTHIGYSEKDDALQITTRIFIDDLDKVLEARYGLKMNLDTESESPLADEYLEKYLRNKLVIELNGVVKEYAFLGKEYDTDMVVCYMEIPKIGLASLKTIQIQDEVLTDIFDEQQNVVHFNVKDVRKSVVLLKSNTKGMLNL